jgi:hypothetical protein
LSDRTGWRRFLLALSLIYAVSAFEAPSVQAQAAPGCAPGETPTYVFGFAALHDKLGATMGSPSSCEYADPNGTGDTEQNTTVGLAFWRKSTNTPTFTDGSTHWALTPGGDVSWVGASIDPPADAVRVAFRWIPSAPTRTSECGIESGRPDPGCTPGALSPDVTQDTIQSTICVAGYSGRVRPPTSYTSPLERQLLVAYGRPGASPADFELDHLISLELGGAPRDVANLWPEAYAGDANARQKDVVENYLHAEVCAGRLPLSQAQRMIATDWVSVYHQIRP